MKKNNVQIAKEVMRLTNVDVFKNTRKREVVEARSLLSTLLYKYKKNTLTNIARFYEENGKSMNHSTVIHAVRSFEVHKKYRKRLNDWLSIIVMDLNHIDSKAKRVFVIDQINQLTDKQVSALAELVQDMVNQNIALDTIYK
jgi:hypothetical protein